MLAIAAALLTAGQPLAGQSVAWGAGLIGGVAQLVFYQALAVGLVSIVALVSAGGTVLPVVVAVVRGEVPGPLAAVGITAVIAGSCWSRCSRDPQRMMRATRNEDWSLQWAPRWDSACTLSW